MTFKQIYENIAMDFPTYLETTIAIDVDNIYRDFCYKTGLPRKNYKLTLSTATSYSLATDVNRIYEVEITDSTGKLIDDVSYIIDDGTIYFFDTYGATLTTLPTNVYQVTIYYHAAPAAAISTSSASPDIPTQFHTALVEGVEAKYYRRAKDFQNSVLAKQAYAEFIRDGKQWANINGISRHSVDVEPIYNANWVNTNLTT